MFSATGGEQKTNSRTGSKSDQHRKNGRARIMLRRLSIIILSKIRALRSGSIS